MNPKLLAHNKNLRLHFYNNKQIQLKGYGRLTFGTDSISALLRLAYHVVLQSGAETSWEGGSLSFHKKLSPSKRGHLRIDVVQDSSSRRTQLMESENLFCFLPYKNRPALLNRVPILSAKASSMEWVTIFSHSVNHNGVKRDETVSLSADDPTGIWSCIFRQNYYETFVLADWEHLGIVEPKIFPVRYFFELDRHLQYHPTPLSLQPWQEQNIHSEFRKRLKQTKEHPVGVGSTVRFEISSVFSITYSMTKNGLTRRGSATRVFLIPAEHHDHSAYKRMFGLNDQKHQLCLEFERSTIHNEWVAINVLCALEPNHGSIRRTERIYHEVAGGPIVVNITIQTEFFSPTDSPFFRRAVKSGDEQTLYQTWQSLQKISPEIQQCEITVPDPYQDKMKQYWSDWSRYEFEKEWLFEPD